MKSSPLIDLPPSKLPEPVLWAGIFFLFATARLFESGLSLDPAIYATIARNFAGSGDWWNMRAGAYFFPDFYEHPFLAFWLQGGLFKVFGASDYTARFLGVISGAFSGYHLFQIACKLGDTALARITCALTLLSIPFMGRMATLYLEIPLMWFALACLDHAITSLSIGSRRDAVLAGVYLGLCFLTKGIATFPLVGVLGGYTLYLHRKRFTSQPVMWLSLPLGLFIFIVFLALQANFGSYSFADKYISTGLFGKAIRPGVTWLLPAKFFWQFVLLHPAHCLLAVLAPLFLWKGKSRFQDALVFGGLGVLMFGLANGLLGRFHQHYFYPLFPFANLLAASTVCAASTRDIGSFRWTRTCLILAIIYQVIWNWIPAVHRKKAWADYFEIAPRIHALRGTEIDGIDAVGITDPNWSFPAMSLWYWKVDSRILAAGATPSSKLVLIERGADRTSAPSGYELCYSGERFSLWIASGPLVEACRSQSMSPRLLR